MSDETIEEWARRKAPTLTSVQWTWLRACSWKGVDDSTMTGDIAEDSRRRAALLAYRDKMAREVVAWQDKNGFDRDAGVPDTDWGREVAGVMEDDAALVERATKEQDR